MVGGQETVPEPAQVPQTLPPALLVCLPPGPQPRVTPWQADTGAPQPTPPSSPPVGTHHPFQPPQTPRRRQAGRQSISPPVAARTTRGRVRKVIPSRCVPMPAQGRAAAGGQPQSTPRPPLQSTRAGGGLGREAALPAPRQPGEILRSSLCTAVKYSSQGLSF